MTTEFSQTHILSVEAWRVLFAMRWAHVWEEYAKETVRAVDEEVTKQVLARSNNYRFGGGGADGIRREVTEQVVREQERKFREICASAPELDMRPILFEDLIYRHAYDLWNFVTRQCGDFDCVKNTKKEQARELVSA